MDTKQRIRRIWKDNGHRRRPRGDRFFTIGADGGSNGSSSSLAVTYPASSVTTTTADFLGDWRSADSWMRFDLFRVRARSRQLERGNPWCVAFKRNLINNVLGYKGFHFKSNVISSAAFGDSVSEEQPDNVANTAIELVMAKFGLAENFTTNKRLNRTEEDRLILSRLIFDGEVIIRKNRGFKGNDWGFAWQNINPDYLDHNLNRVEKNGNVIRMGVEMDATYRFPIAYWFLKKRPNDYFYNYQKLTDGDYIRVPADEIFHFYLLTEDDEQTRGWPWVFAAIVGLFRMGKYQEAALVNAAIGASRGIYFTKDYPEGFAGDPDELKEVDEGEVTVDLPQGSGLELPFGVKPYVVDMKYPDNEFKDFCNALLLTTSAVFGTSYATTSGDLSQANFVSSRIGQIEEREYYKSIQEWLKEKWKLPAFGEELYRSIISGQLSLPVGRFGKFNAPQFTGRRWQFVQPVDDMRANELKLNNLVCSVSDIINETSQEDVEDVFIRIQNDNRLMEKYGLQRIITAGKAPAEEPGKSPPGPEPVG